MYDMAIVVCNGYPRSCHSYHRILHFIGLIPKGISFDVGITDTILAVGKKTIDIVEAGSAVILLFFYGGQGYIAAEYLVF